MVVQFCLLQWFVGLVVEAPTARAVILDIPLPNCDETECCGCGGEGESCWGISAAAMSGRSVDAASSAPAAMAASQVEILEVKLAQALEAFASSRWSLLRWSIGSFVRWLPT